MQRMNHLSKEINANWKKPSVALLVLLMSLVFQACTSVPVKVKPKNEIWYIDAEDLVLFRVISETKEQAVPIKNNPAMKKMMCIHEDEFESTVQGVFDADPE